MPRPWVSWPPQWPMPGRRVASSLTTTISGALIAQGLSNHEIGERLFLALDTVKGHNRKIFSKLQVQRRTEAVARARERSGVETTPRTTLSCLPGNTIAGPCS